MTQDWITIEYRTRKHSRTMRADQVVPAHLRSMSRKRPATADEIKIALAAEETRAKELRARNDFEARPDYIDAMKIRNALECMSHSDHCLDRLTLEEWAALREKLCR